MFDLLADPDKGSYIWYLFSFVIFAGLAWKLGSKAIANKLDQRIEGIRKDIETAENLRVEAQELLAQYQRKHRDAMKDAERIIADARKNAKESIKQAEKELDETIKLRETQLQGRLKRMEESAIHEIKAYAADLAMKAATEIITEKLDKKTAEKLVDQSIKDVASNLH